MTPPPEMMVSPALGAGEACFCCGVAYAVANNAMLADIESATKRAPLRRGRCRQDRSLCIESVIPRAPFTKSCALPHSKPANFILGYRFAGPMVHYRDSCGLWQGLLPPGNTGICNSSAREHLPGAI